jgi:hypothetical protein
MAIAEVDIPPTRRRVCEDKSDGEADGEEGGEGDEI